MLQYLFVISFLAELISSGVPSSHCIVHTFLWKVYDWALWFGTLELCFLDSDFHSYWIVWIWVLRARSEIPVSLFFHSLPREKARWLLSLCWKVTFSLCHMNVNLCPAPCYDQSPGHQMYIWFKYTMELHGELSDRFTI